MVALVDSKHRSQFGFQEETTFEKDSQSQMNLNVLLNELEKTKKNFDFNDGYITIESPSHMELILESYADADKRKILEITADKAKPIMEILNTCNIPQTSAYRKVTMLIAEGMIIPNGCAFKHGRRITKYKSIFENVEINMVRNKLQITVKLAEKDQGT
ncbi:Uncharacterised protein [uncultured archaeon]|nr:Uncharacterised protein [uncultured archaeon]